MSAPNTNLEKQTKRHRPALWGIAVALLIAAIVFVTALLWPGVPLDEQAAPDGVATEVAPASEETQ